MGQDSGFPAVNFDAWNLNTAVNTHVNVQGNHSRSDQISSVHRSFQTNWFLFSVIRDIAAASTVLLKNVGNVLPLKAPKSIGIIGNGAAADSKGPNGWVQAEGL